MMKISKRCLLLLSLFFIVMRPVLASTVLITNVLSNSVSLYDDASLLPIKKLKVGLMPHEVAVVPNGKLALVSNFGDLLNALPGNSLTVIDIANAKIRSTITLPEKSRPHGIAFLSNTTALITAQGVQSLFVVDITNGTVKQTIPLPGAGAHMVIADKEKHFAYVANAMSGTICKIDLHKFSVIGDIKVGKEVEGLALTNDEDLLLTTAREDNEVAVIRTNDLSLLKKIKTDKGPIRIALFNTGKSAIITNTLSGTAQVMDLSQLAITHTFDTSQSHSALPVPINIVVRDDQVTAYITNSFANTVTLVDLVNGKIIKTFDSGYMPDGVAVSQIDAISTDNATDAVFKADPILINANIDNVWQISKNVEDYYRLSQGAVSAHVEGEILPGKTIKLILYKDKIIGKFIPESEELVTVVDNERKILAWVRKLPDGNMTARYQILEKISENKTRSSIVLHIPGPIGKATEISYGKLINQAFNDLNNGIKLESERALTN